MIRNLLDLLSVPGNFSLLTFASRSHISPFPHDIWAFYLRMKSPFSDVLRFSTSSHLQENMDQRYESVEQISVWKDQRQSSVSCYELWDETMDWRELWVHIFTDLCPSKQPSSSSSSSCSWLLGGVNGRVFTLRLLGARRYNSVYFFPSGSDSVCSTADPSNLPSAHHTSVWQWK